MNEYWEVSLVSLDDLSENIFPFFNGDHNKRRVLGSHYWGYEGNRESVKSKMLDRFGELLDEMMYLSDNYGTPVEDD